MIAIRHVRASTTTATSLLSRFTMNYMDMSYFAAPPTLGINAVSTRNEEEQSA